MKDNDQTQKKLVLTIPLEDNHQALLIFEVLNVDKELKASEIQRTITTEENNLIVTFEGTNYKKLRVTSNVLLQNVLLIVKTIQKFSPEVNIEHA